ncbi:BadF/BadG/BcrA/BcrD ATPase family protein [Thermocatellispora tengchongensis]
MKVVLGVDAGGTSTRAMVASPDGLRAARASGPGGNPSARGVEAACAAIAGAVTRALEAYGGGPEIAAAVLGVAGHEPFLTGAGREALLRALPVAGARLQVVGDVPVAFAAGTPEPSGTVLISGTGAVAAAIEDREAVAIADGLGWLLGDRGSGYWLGRRAAESVVRRLAGGEPDTPLTHLIVTAVLGHGPQKHGPQKHGLQKHGPREHGPREHGPQERGPREHGPHEEGRSLANAVIRSLQSAPPAAVAALAPHVGTAASQGDPVATEIVTEAAALLAETVAAVRRPGDTTPIVLAGSVLTTPGPVREAVHDLLSRRWRAPIATAGSGAGAAAWLAARTLLGPAATPAHPLLVTSGADE